MALLFWLCFGLLMYSFIGYPIVLKLLSLFRPANKRAPWPHAKALSSPRVFIGDPVTSTKSHLDSGLGPAGMTPCDPYDYVPTVSIVLSVYNEAAVIAEKIDNFLALDYPPDRLELVVISDQCSDRTEPLIVGRNCDRIKLFRQKQRSGKTLNLNRGVAEASGEMIVFTDANSMFAADAIRKLVQPLSDPRIGLVSGRSIYLDSNNEREELGGAYRAYEELLKRLESRIGSIVGADGAIYALRRELYEPLKSEYINDFIHTGQVAMQGLRAISEPEAVCRETVDEALAGEFGRQVRMMAQSWLIYCTQIGNLLKGGYLVYAWELTSHKLLRWLTLPLMLGLLLTTAFLARAHPLYYGALLVQIGFWLWVVVGSKAKSSLIRFPFTFFLVHWAAILGLKRYLSGDIFATWTPRNE